MTSQTMVPTPGGFYRVLNVPVRVAPPVPDYPRSVGVPLAFTVMRGAHTRAYNHWRPRP